MYRIFIQHLTICPECGGSMQRVKGNGISKTLILPPGGYPEEYLWRERNGGDEQTAFIKILSHIAALNYNAYEIFHISIFIEKH